MKINPHKLTLNLSGDKRLPADPTFGGRTGSAVERIVASAKKAFPNGVDVATHDRIKEVQAHCLRLAEGARGVTATGEEFSCELIKEFIRRHGDRVPLLPVAKKESLMPSNGSPHQPPEVQ